MKYKYVNGNFLIAPESLKEVEHIMTFVNSNKPKVVKKKSLYSRRRVIKRKNSHSEWKPKDEAYISEEWNKGTPTNIIARKVGRSIKSVMGHVHVMRESGASINRPKKQEVVV